MRTVMYYVPRDIELTAGVNVLAGYWQYDQGGSARYKGYSYFWGAEETGVMRLAQNDLDTLVKHGLVVLGEISCEP